MRRFPGLLLPALLLAAGAAWADDSPRGSVSAVSTDGSFEGSTEGSSEGRLRFGDWRWWLDNEFYAISANVRPRVELADQDGKEFSQAWTVRSLLGLGTKPWHGLSAFVQMEGTFSFARRAFFDGTSSTGTDKTQISDPDFIQLNQGYAQYENPELLGLELRGGREGINYDDQRWVGTVFWRQNEVSFDSASGVTTLGIEGLTAGYTYVWEVNRIFADKGPSSTEDWDSDSHWARIHYDGWEPLEMTAFVYLMDFKNNSPGNSSDTYGFRVNGSQTFAKKWKASYTASYAYQTDAASNPVDYETHYAWASGALAYLPLGEVGVGYEHLGSDDGKARLVTPLATAHKFNGFADVFLDNGGTDGLRDLFVTVSPKLPWSMKGSIIVHQFWSDEGGDDLGWEFDLVASRPFGEYVTVLTKLGVFDGSDASRADIWRYWLQLTFAF